MNDNISNWIEHPTEFYPPTDNIISIMEWHVALMKQIDKPCPKVWETVTDICEIQVDRDQIRREEDFFRTLDCQTIALIETAVLIGCELAYGRNENLKRNLMNTSVNVDTLADWSEVLGIDLTAINESNKAQAVDYVLSKRPDYWQKYLNRVEV